MNRAMALMAGPAVEAVVATAAENRITTRSSLDGDISAATQQDVAVAVAPIVRRRVAASDAIWPPADIPRRKMRLRSRSYFSAQRHSCESCSRHASR